MPKKMKTFKQQLNETPGASKAAACFLCGSCTAGCPVNEIDENFNPRKLMRMLLLDMKEEVLSSPEIWKCNQCHACVAHCPQDARFADVVRALRDMAITEGHAPAALLPDIKAIGAEMHKQRLAQIEKRLSQGLEAQA